MIGFIQGTVIAVIPIAQFDPVIETRLIQNRFRPFRANAINIVRAMLERAALGAHIVGWEILGIDIQPFRCKHLLGAKNESIAKTIKEMKCMEKSPLKPRSDAQTNIQFKIMLNRSVVEGA